MIINNNLSLERQFFAYIKSKPNIYDDIYRSKSLAIVNEIESNIRRHEDFAINNKFVDNGDSLSIYSRFNNNIPEDIDTKIVAQSIFSYVVFGRATKRQEDGDEEKSYFVGIDPHCNKF